MNRKALTSFYRIVVAILLTSVLTLAFVWTRPASGEQIENVSRNQKPTAVAKRKAAVTASETAAFNAEKRGFPLLNLRDGQIAETEFFAANGAAQSKSGNGAFS